MLDMLSSALASAKTASEMGKSLLTLRDEEKIRAAVFDLRRELADLLDQVLNAKEEQLRLLGRVAELEQERSDRSEKARLRARYERHQFETGHVAYRLKTEHQTEEPEHFICSNCLERDGSLITLHGKNRSLHCPSCKTQIRATPAEPRKIVRSNRFRSVDY